MEKTERFKLIEKDRKAGATVYVDTVTGINYLFLVNGYAGGLTPLLDRNGNPVVSSLPIID